MLIIPVEVGNGKPYLHQKEVSAYELAEGHVFVGFRVGIDVAIGSWVGEGVGDCVIFFVAVIDGVDEDVGGNKDGLLVSHAVNTNSEPNVIKTIFHRIK